MPSILDIGERQTLARRTHVEPARCIDAMFDGQDHSALLRLVPSFEDPPPELRIISFRNAYLHIGPGCDGVVVTQGDELVEETARFCPTFETRSPQRLREVAIDVDDDWVTVVDGAWHNHYHLLTLAAPKLYLARRHAPTARVVLPRRSRSASAHSGAGPLENILALAGYDAAILRLEDGVYRVRNLRVVWTNYVRAAFLHVFDEPFDIWRSLGQAVPDDEAASTPRKIFIERAQNPRLADPVVISALNAQLDRQGFSRVRLELMPFEDQVRLFRRASHVVAAHGAGLSNIVFGNARLRLLELNSDVDGAGFLRPWFLLLANGKGMQYNYLDVTPGELSKDGLRDAFDRFMAAPSPVTPAFGSTPSADLNGLWNPIGEARIVIGAGNLPRSLAKACI